MWTTALQLFSFSLLACFFLLANYEETQKIATVMLLCTLLMIAAVYGSVKYVMGAHYSFAEYFETDQFLFIGLSNCHLTVERSPPPGNCPYHVIYQTSTYETSPPCSLAKLHVLLADKELPQALILAPSFDGYVVAKLNHLHWPEEGASQFAFRSTLIDLKDPSPVGSKIDYQDLLFTLFDNDSRLLYLVLNSTSSQRRSVSCYIFYADLSKTQISFLYIGQMPVHPENDFRVLWSEDPYERKFYYGVKQDEELGLYSVPFNELLSVLSTGSPGTLELLFHDDRAYFSVTHDVVLSYMSSSSRIVYFTLHLKKKNSNGIVCELPSKKSKLSSSVSLSLLFDSHYCALRNKETSLENCSLVLSNMALKTFVLILVIRIRRRKKTSMDETFARAESPHIHTYPAFVAETSDF
ncbi:unnamed protein product [Enterobius vermicularis]|uniref:DPPIV_N domain-containing protein n=1 Tax=Enterobius vermicularis TaxID=51028 RepID=A0A0N4VEU0_ENTVE|nr:unnamed protein product [Enterobius vermicularis]